MPYPKLLISISGSGKIQVVLTGSPFSRVGLLSGFEKYIEPKLPLMRSSLRLKLAVENASL